MQYNIRFMLFEGRACPVILQLHNGPCPLIALCNVLFLRGKLTLPPDTLQVSFEQLCSMLQTFLQRQVESIVASSKGDADATRVANALQYLEDASKLLPKLESGLDVNVQFGDPLSFEPNVGTQLFELCNVRLVHGWVYDPQDEATKRVIGRQTHDELMAKLTLEYTPPADGMSDEQKSEALVQFENDKNIATQFIQDTLSQLTIAGLAALHSILKDHELAVLFRNNHFSTIIKHNNKLYTLITDFGLISAGPYIAWAYVNDTQGDNLFLDHDWLIPHPITVDRYSNKGAHRLQDGHTLLHAPPTLDVYRLCSGHAQQQQQQPRRSPTASFAQDASSSAAANVEQQRFARENGLRWNAQTQNYEPLQPPATHPHVPQQKAELKRSDSCVIL